MPPIKQTRSPESHAVAKPSAETVLPGVETTGLQSRLQSPAKGYPVARRFDEEIAALLARAGYGFVSIQPCGLVPVLGARWGGVGGPTVGVVTQPAADQLSRQIRYGFETLGCDHLLFVCSRRSRLKHLAQELRQTGSPKWRARITLVTRSALRRRFKLGTPESSSLTRLAAEDGT